MKKLPYPPVLNVKLRRTRFWPFPLSFLAIMLLLSLGACMEEPEDLSQVSKLPPQLAQVKQWFEANKEQLRIRDGGASFRTESQELIMPFFEKEPDWDKFHHYRFPDGREVYEVSLQNAKKYFLTEMKEAFPNQDVSELVVQNIMFVKHPTMNRFDPVIARYYPSDIGSVRKFEDISYDRLPYDWSGTVDIWTYDERHFIGFNFEDGSLVNYFRYNKEADPESGRILGDCWTVVREVNNNYSDQYGVVVMPPTYLTETHCTGSGGYTPKGGNGTGEDGEYHEYERPTCCQDLPTAPPRDVPPYEPPAIPAPATIINRLTDPCAKDIFLELSKGNAYLTETGEIVTPGNFLGVFDIFPGMLDLFEKSGKFDYRIQNGTISSGANGITQRINGVNTITLNNEYLNNATSLSIARTIIHETVHAYLLEHTNNMDLRLNYNTFDLIEKYNLKYPKSIGDTHHAAMSQFILGMAVSLYNWDRKYGPTAGNLTFDYYYKMAFGGLVKNYDPTQLIEEAKQFIPQGSSWSEISSILVNEATSNIKSNGTKCK